jgi:hypothetical protein
MEVWGQGKEGVSDADGPFDFPVLIEKVERIAVPVGVGDDGTSRLAVKYG